MLRLHRIYLFITLACLLALFFDLVALWLGTSSAEGQRVFLYNRFLYAILFPLAAWDSFEEVKTQIAKLRRLAAARLVSGLFFAAIFGLIMSAFFETKDANGGSALVTTLGLILWAGSSTASLAFLWTLHRQIRAQNIARPNNTFVWMTYYELSLIGEVLSCLSLLVLASAAAYVSSQTADTLNIAFNSYGILVTAWCILKLRAVASDFPSAPENASL